MFKIILFSFFGLLSVGVISGYFFINDIRNSASPQYKGEISIEGLGSDVVVYRDDRGMPHIYAGNEYDLYFSVGYMPFQQLPPTGMNHIQLFLLVLLVCHQVNFIFRRQKHILTGSSIKIRSLKRLLRLQQNIPLCLCRSCSKLSSHPSP